MRVLVHSTSTVMKDVSYSNNDDKQEAELQQAMNNIYLQLMGGGKG